MTDQNENLEDLEGSENLNEGTQAPKELRKLADKRQTKIVELEKELETFKSAAKERSLADALTAKGVNPKVAKFLKADGVEGDEAITKWLTENQDILLINQVNGDGSANLNVKPNASAEDIEAARKFQNLGSSSSSPSSVDYATKVAGTTTKDEVLALLNEQLNNLKR